MGSMSGGFAIRRVTCRKIRPTVVAAAAFVLLAVLPCGMAWSRAAAVTAPVSTAAAPDRAAMLLQLLHDPRATQVFDLLGDPTVRAALQQRLGGASGPAGGVSQTPGRPDTDEPMTMATGLEATLEVLRSRMVGFGRILPEVPGAYAAAFQRLAVACAAAGPLLVLIYGLIFVLGGWIAQTLFLRTTVPLQNRMAEAGTGTVAQRIRVMLVRLGYTLVWQAAVVAGSLGAFLLFEWPPLVGILILKLLICVVLISLSLRLTRWILAPGNERMRILPMSTAAAWFWHYRIAVLTAVVVSGWQFTGLLDRLGVSAGVQYVTDQGFGLIAAAMLVATIWSGAALPAGADGEVDVGGDNRGNPWPVVMALYFAAIWLLFLVHVTSVAWCLIVLFGLVCGISIVHRAIAHVMRSDGPVSPEDRDWAPIAVVAERIMRVVLIGTAALLAARALHLDAAMMDKDDTVTIHLVRGAMNAVVIFMIADLVWQLIRIFIDRKLRATTPSGEEGERNGHQEIGRDSRLRTLLPILRNILFITVLVIAGLMALSELGVQIGPLLAGAGVVGVAVGFGSQTLVRDVLSGIFFLLDDAFRVGEYIESGPIRGTVEAFSLRSVKLRHHRGPLHTVPFGDLKVVTNHSRDWVIDKIQLGVGYDTDLNLLKRVIKQISADIMAMPELAAVILEAPKSQGIFRMADYGMIVRLKVKTKPGEQFIVRRIIYEKVKASFDASGIVFASPTVRVAGDPGIMIDPSSATSSSAAASSVVLDRIAAQNAATPSRLP